MDLAMFLDMTMKAQVTKEKKNTDKWDYIKTAKLLCIRGHNQQSERQATK